ncbi:MAG: SAM-dependent methyltransferase [Caulobacteraceae bacterium]
MSLKARLEALIALNGPMSTADYMELCLHHPDFGYYATRPRLGGAGGDFITAPLVSQMFGELIGLWAVETWDRLGRPAPFRLVEVGPGDGTLMQDALRAARLVPEFIAAADLWLVEPSPPLAACQRDRLEGAAPTPKWAASLDAVPGGAPLILVANEVLDCLPARQFVRLDDGWAERRVGVDAGSRLYFGLAPVPAGFAPPAGLEASAGALVEISTAQEGFAHALGAQVVADGGAALLIDYGRSAPEAGDTLQAIRDHVREGPLDHPGEADLTVHADFPAVAAAARAAGAEVTPTITQGELLTRLGVEARAASLSRARPDRAERIAREVHRLTADDQMGQLFKAVAIHSPGLSVPGFDA